MTEPRQTIFPALRYADAAAALGFLEQAFGFERQAVFDGPNGTIAHAEARLGTAAIAFSSATPPDGANPWTSVRGGLYAVLPDAAAVDALAAQAERAGARIAQPLHDTSYGSRECSIWDVAGHLWSFGTYTWAPSGEPTLFVGLQAQEAPAAIAWLRDVFGCQPGLIVPGAGGAVAHAELHWHGSVLMLWSESEAAEWFADRQSTSIRVLDPDAHHARAVKAGARIVSPLAQTSYGARSYTALDPGGFAWTFSTYRPQPLA